jgi:hypothetical protein
MKLISIFLFIILFHISLFSQWQHIQTTPAIPYNTVSGWLNFDKTGDGWVKRMYLLDSTQFKIMEQGFSFQTAYTYNFSPGEILAGLNIYSLNADLNNNGSTDFYVLSYAGVTTPARQIVKIFDITTNEIFLIKDNPNYYYSYPILADVDNDGKFEVLIPRYEYPMFSTYQYEIYDLNLVSAPGESERISFQLHQNYPNPFNPSTTIAYTLNTPSLVTLKIYDIQGELIKSITNVEGHSGYNELEWDGINNRGSRQPSGVYFYSLDAGSYRQTKKMLLLK